MVKLLRRMLVGKEIALSFKSAICCRVVVCVIRIHGQIELLWLRDFPVPDI